MNMNTTQKLAKTARMIMEGEKTPSNLELAKHHLSLATGHLRQHVDDLIDNHGFDHEDNNDALNASHEALVQAEMELGAIDEDYGKGSGETQFLQYKGPIG